MDNKYIIAIPFFLLLLILILASSNFIITNKGLQETFMNAQLTMDKTDSLLNEQLMSDIKNNQAANEILARQERVFKKYLLEMNDLKKGIHDSNTISFLTSFVLVFLGGILLGIETRTKKHINNSEKQIKKAQKILNRTEIEQSTIDLYTKVQLLRFLTTMTQNKLASSNYLIDNSIKISIYQIFKSIEELLKDFQNDKYKYCSKEWKKAFDDIFEKLIYAFDKDEILESPKNSDKTRDIEKTIDKLRELQYKISTLKELDPE